MGGGRGANRRAQRSYSPACTARVRAGPAKGWTVAMRLSWTGSGMGSAEARVHCVCRTAELEFAFALASPSVPAPTSGYGDGGGWMHSWMDHGFMNLSPAHK
jgi:hypothetical protein